MQFAAWFPVEYIDRAPNVAMQFIVAEKEELMDNKDNGILAYQRAKGPKNLVTIPEITHYGVYMVPPASQKARELSIAAFHHYLISFHPPNPTDPPHQNAPLTSTI